MHTFSLQLKSSILSMRVDIERKNAQISELGEIFYNANSGDHNVEGIWSHQPYSTQLKPDFRDNLNSRLEFEALSELIITIQDLREQISSVQRDYHDSITEEQNLKSEISSVKWPAWIPGRLLTCLACLLVVGCSKQMQNFSANFGNSHSREKSPTW